MKNGKIQLDNDDKDLSQRCKSPKNCRPQLYLFRPITFSDNRDFIKKMITVMIIMSRRLMTTMSSPRQ